MIDLDLPARPRRRIPLLAVVALVSGLAGGLVATMAHARTPEPTHEVSFSVVGDGKVEYAALVTPYGVEQVASVVPHRVRAGTTVVLTVRSVAPTWWTSCRILVDGEVVDEGEGGGGNSVTCVATVHPLT